MQTAVEYIDQALGLGAKEFDALTQGDVSKALELSGQRSWVLSLAWDARRGCDDEAYKKLLFKVHDMQVALTKLAQEKRAEIRQGLLRSQKENKRLEGYRQALTHAV